MIRDLVVGPMMALQAEERFQTRFQEIGVDEQYEKLRRDP